MDATSLQQKLRDDSDGGPLDRLAGLVVEQALDTLLVALVPPERLVRGAKLALAGWLRSEDAVPALTRAVAEIARRAAGDRRRLAAVLPSEFRQAARELARRPMVPDRQLVLTVLDRPPVRRLVRGLLLNALLDFGHQMSAPLGGVAQGLGGLAKYAFDTAKLYSGGIGAAVGAVSDEMERQLQKRAAEFADAGLAGVFAQIADAVSSPQRAAEAAELRVAVWEGVLELTLVQLSRELVGADVPGAAAIVRDALARWLDSPAADATLARWAEQLLAREGGRTLREVLHELGLVEAVRQLGREALRARMGAVVASDAFAAWLAALLVQ